MKKSISLILLVFSLMNLSSSAQTIARHVIASSGGTLTSSAGQINYNIGEPMIASLSAGGNLVSQGFEQPAESRLNLKLFLQGYYDADLHSMRTVLLNQGINAPENETDTLLLELHDAVNYELLDSKKAVLMADGSVTADFLQPEGNYYVAVKHRNSIQTWTAGPIACSASTSLYNFTQGSAAAYGENMIEVEPGTWAFYSGDLNQDEYIDAFDFFQYNDDNLSGISNSYVPSDFNGDGFVDAFDFQIYNDNNLNGISSIHP